MSGACAFCAIAGGADGAHHVYEDAACLGFLDRSPLALGHVLLIPKAHVASLFEADDETVAALARATRRVALAVKEALAADGVFVAQNNIVSQSVPHLHIHVVPRFKGDGLFAARMIWKRVRYTDEAQRQAMAARIRAALV